MDAASILLTSTVLLAVAAIGGAVMAGMRFTSERQPPAALAMLHGVLAAAALTLLIYAAATVGLPGMALGAVGLFIVASGGGAILNLKYHWNRLPLPKWLVIVHAIAAVAGFALLLAATWATRAS